MISGSYMTVGEAACQLQIDESLVTRYCRQGRLGAEQVGRQWLIRKRSLETFLKKPRRVGNPNFGSTK